MTAFLHRLAVIGLVLTGLLGPAGCSSLPVLTPEMALNKHAPVRLEGARGPLSPQQSKAILTRLENGGKPTGIFEQHLALEQSIMGSGLVVGNKATLLMDGPSTYDAMFAAIAQAKDNIDMDTYIIEDDDMGRRFSDALIAKQKAGVQVNFMYDSVGSIGTPREFFQRLKDAGINVLEYNPVNPLALRKGWDINQRNHRKLLVVDGRVAFVGGINISSVYSSGSSFSRKTKKPPTPGKSEEPWRDTHIRIEGPVAADFQTLFLNDWKQQKGDPLAARNYYPAIAPAGDDIVRAIGSAPDQPYSLIYVTLLSAINSAQSQVYLTNAYFVPDPQMLTALKDAVARGVDVRLLLPGKSDSALVYYTSRSFYEELLEAGVKIYERQQALLHAKTAVIDGVWSTIGSTNLDWRSFTLNQEIDAVVLGSAFGTQMQNMFNQDLKVSDEMTLEKWHKRPIGSRLKEFGARLWARLL
ncbi:MAG: phospholipase D/Transphosphatidylase [Herbaspirillum sp.]|nr:phospholipase D/Transphosphatidylase [Herbaspirillum sp.]